MGKKRLLRPLPCPLLQAACNTHSQRVRVLNWNDRQEQNTQNSTKTGTGNLGNRDNFL